MLVEADRGNSFPLASSCFRIGHGMKFWPIRHEGDVHWGLWEWISSMEKERQRKKHAFLPQNIVSHVKPGAGIAIVGGCTVYKRTSPHPEEGGSSER